MADILDTFIGCAYAGPHPRDCSKDIPQYADVFLESSGPNKILVIKLLRDYHLNYKYGSLTNYYYSDRPWYNKNLTLKEAKELADKPLSLIYEDVYISDAKLIKEEFEKLGAKIQIVVTSWEPYMGR